MVKITTDHIHSFLAIFYNIPKELNEQLNSYPKAQWN